jgi:hypothetical protein
VIDKADFRIPEFALPGPSLASDFEGLRRREMPGFQPSRYYQYNADLRERYGIDAIIHLWCRFGRPNHKVEIVDAGKKTLFEIAEIIAQLFEVDPWTVETMRVDTAADIENVPVPWFLNNTCIDRKRFSSKIANSAGSETRFIAMAMATIQTIYAGKRPNLIRFYDKGGEWLMQYRRIQAECARHNAGMKGMALTDEQRFFGQRFSPTFEEFTEAEGHRMKPNGVLTRVERQIGARIPEELKTLGNLRNAHNFQPFTSLKFIRGGMTDLMGMFRDDVPVRDSLAAIGLITLIEHMGGAQMAKYFVYQRSNGNGKRILESLEAASSVPVVPITLDDIQESYRISTMKQTANQ